jgi:hypothetical protein
MTEPNLPATLVPATLVPATLVPATLVPATLVPATLVPATLVPATLVPATAVITADNVTKLVKLYFESQLMTLTSSAFSKFCIAWGNDAYLNGNTSSTAYLSNYAIFWAIRLLVETEKYDYDDIEFHVKHNPIFADLNAEDIEDGREKPNNQSRLLRQAINTYKQEAEKKDRAEKKALAEQRERAAYIDATLSTSAAANRLTKLILIGSKL